MDLIDLQSCPDGGFKYLLNYQDHGIKLYDCRPLTSKRNVAIAFALLDIFSFIGPPTILQADNGRELSGHAGKQIGAHRNRQKSYQSAERSFNLQNGDPGTLSLQNGGTHR